MLFRLLRTALLETVWMVTVSGAISVVLGTLVGAALVFFSDPGLGRGWRINRIFRIDQVLSAIVNVGRSLPFLVLMVAIIPLTRFLVGTSIGTQAAICLLYTSPSPRDRTRSRMPSSA